MTKRTALAMLLLCVFLGAICPAENPKILIRTNFGDIGIELYPDDAPITVDNFLQYLNDGFYDGLIFHRAINNFMIQGGGFETISVSPGLAKRTEGLRDPIANESNNNLLNVRGTISMALLPGDPNSGTSGFFINQIHNTHLDGLHTVFGQVLTGMNLVDWITTLPHVEPPILGLTDIPIYTAGNGQQYWVYVYETIIAPDGYWLLADINYDGIVDENDLNAVSSAWLTEEKLGDIILTGLVGFDEFAQVAKSWKRTSVWKRAFEADIDNNRVVNLNDYALLAKDWNKTADELYGDLDLDGSCNYLDLFYLADDWLKDAR